MPDFTITLTNEEVILWESYYGDVTTGLRQKALKHSKSLAKAIITQSTSKLDANKLTVAEMRTEISRLQTEGEILTFRERYPDIGD